jgi:hypothetical protein
VLGRKHEAYAIFFWTLEMEAKSRFSLSFLLLFLFFFSLLKEAIDDSIFIVYKYKVGKAL